MLPLTLGIDLATNTADQVVISTQPGQIVHTQPVSPQVRAWTQVLERVETWRAPGQAVVVILEASGMAWLPVAAFFQARQIPVYRIKGEQSTEFRQVLAKYVKQDRLDAEALTRLYYMLPDRLHPLQLPSAPQHALKRACQRREDYCTAHVREQNRLQELLKWVLPSRAGQVDRLLAPTRRAILPILVNLPVVATQAWAAFWAQLQATDVPLSTAQARRWYAAAQDAAALHAPAYVDFAALVREVQDYVAQLAHLEGRIAQWDQEIATAYAQMPPVTHQLETLPGVGAHTSAVLSAFLGRGDQFSNRAQVEAFVGLIPATHATGTQNRKGTPIRKDGPSVLKKACYLAADVARRWDPQLAAIYYREMVHKGNTHTQAVCRCVNALLGRIWRILRTGEPYELRDGQGAPISAQDARTVIVEQYTVPEEVRHRSQARTSAA